MRDYLDLFGEALGRMKGKAHLETDPNVAPTVMHPRRVRPLNTDSSHKPRRRSHRVGLQHDCNTEIKWHHSSLY